MKLSTVIKTNNSLKAKIASQIKAQGKTNSIAVGPTKVKSEDSLSANESLKTQVTQKLSENNFISAPQVDRVKSASIQNLSSAGMNALIHQNDKVDYRTVDDGTLIGGYRVVHTIDERNAIDCCYRKLGMIVMVVGDDLSFTEYMLTGEVCSNEGWILYQVDSNDQIVLEDDVILTEDYSILDPTQQIETQKDLNRVLKEILEQLINNPVSGDKHYTHEQTLPSAHWVITHNLGKRPSVTVVDSANTVLMTPYRFIDDDKIEIEFNGAFAGKAYLN